MTQSDWKTDYQSRLTTPDRAVERLEAGWRLMLPTLAGAPTALLAAMGKALREERISGLTAGMILPAGNVAEHLLDPAVAGRLQWDSLFCGGVDRPGVNDGTHDMTPMHFSQTPRIMESWGGGVQAVMSLVSPPDENGYMSLGLATDYTKPFMKLAQYRVVEVNPNVPRVGGDCLVHVSEVDAIVESDEEIIELPNTPFNAEDKIIGGHIAERIADGATIQLGYGALPGAVATCLTDHKHLGIHTEMFVDNMRVLMECGAVDNSQKTLHPGKSIYTFCAGTKETYQFLHENPDIEAYPVEYVNDPYVIGRNDKMVTINATVAVDLTGQACSESIGGRQYSGSGGQADFVRGAFLSDGGQSFLGTYATAKGGEVSCIVDMLPQGSVVTTARTDIDMVVSEFGVAELKGRSLRARAQALIAIAHPKFRDDLQEKAKARGLGPR